METTPASTRRRQRDETVALRAEAPDAGFDPTRFQTEPPACYGVSWQLPGRASHSLARTSLCVLVGGAGSARERKLRRGIALTGDKNIGAGRLLVGDAIIAFLLLNEARNRIVERVYGVSREDSNVLTMFALGSLGDGLHGGAARVRGVPARLSVADPGIGAAALKETAHLVAGETSRATPFFGALLAFAVLARAFFPMLRGSIRGVRASFRGVIGGSRRFLAFLGGQ